MALHLSPLAKYLFVLMLRHGSAGNSEFSFEVMPECGTDPNAPTCEIKRVCSTRSPKCAPPRWSKARGGWVKVETREHAAQRMERAAYALTRAAVWVTRCKDSDGNVVEECRKLNWPQGPRSIASAALSASMWESGYREDIMGGYPPAGRGADGEACVMQIMPQYIAAHADWIPAKPEDEMTVEDWAQEILGDDVVSLERCFRIGMRMLSRTRALARRKCPGDSIHGMYAMYGNGGRSCKGASVELGDYASKRTKTYRAFMNRWPDRIFTPDWVVPLYGKVLPHENVEQNPKGIVPPKGMRMHKDEEDEKIGPPAVAKN